MPDTKRAGQAVRDERLVAGREARAADVALVLAQRLETCERASKSIPELEAKVVELTLLVHDVIGVLREEVTAYRAEIETTREENAKLKKGAEAFHTVLKQCIEAGREFQSLEGKIREMKAEGTFNADSIVRAHELAGTTGQMLEKVLGMFSLIATMSEQVVAKHADVVDRNRLEIWLAKARASNG